MYIQPIPPHLLVHTIQYHEFDEDSSFGQKWKAPETIEFTLLQPKTRIGMSSENQEILISGLLFLDARNTIPFKPLKEKSKVVLLTPNGLPAKEWRVNACKHLYALDPVTPHHYEVELI